MSKIYEKMNSANTALLVIDVVNGCCHEKCEEPKFGITFSKIRKIIPKLQSFIDDYRKKVGGLVIFANLTPWRKEFLAENINELYTDPKACYYSEDITGFPENFYIIEPQSNDLIFTKNHYDLFTNEDFVKEMEKRKIRYLVITGVFGDGCVLSTIISGFSKGFNFVILKDLVETADLEIRQKLQKILKEYTFPIMYGKTMNVKEFLNAWGK